MLLGFWKMWKSGTIMTILQFNELPWELPRELPWELKKMQPRELPLPHYSRHPGFDVDRVRKDFPILSRKVNGKPLIWFDNAATTQKPTQVIRRIQSFYESENSNVHRGVHTLAEEATEAYENSRRLVQDFIHAKSPDEIVFVRGTTEAINLIAQTYGKQSVRAGDKVLVSQLEHHANIVPWQMLCREAGASLQVIPVDETGQIQLSAYRSQLLQKPKIVALAHVSNVLGTITPIPDMISLAHQAGAKVVIDGAQGISHVPVDVQELDCDFYAFSGHKIYGPTGIGVLYGKAELLDQMPPYQGGGNIITDVTFERSDYHAPPKRFEAGTGNIADAVGLGAALTYFSNLGKDQIFGYEHMLLSYATEELQRIPGIRLIGTARDKTGVISFTLQNHTNEDIGMALNLEGIAVRAGHHCAQPVLRRFGLESAVRPSFAFYNTFQEVDTMIRVLLHLTQR